jgi:hypothetical protein
VGDEILNVIAPDALENGLRLWRPLLIVGDGEGGTQAFRLPSLPPLPFLETWLTDASVLVTEFDTATAWAVDVTTGGVSPVSQYASANEVGPMGTSVITVGADGYELRAEGISRPLYNFGRHPPVSEVAWSPTGERLYFSMRGIPHVRHLRSGASLALPRDRVADSSFGWDGDAFYFGFGWDGDAFYCLEYDGTLDHVLLVQYQLNGEGNYPPIEPPTLPDAQRFSPFSPRQLKECEKQHFHIFLPTYLPVTFRAAYSFCNHGVSLDYSNDEEAAVSVSSMQKIHIREISARSGRRPLGVEDFESDLKKLGKQDYVEDTRSSYRRVDINGQTGVVVRAPPPGPGVVTLGGCDVTFIRDKTLISLSSANCDRDCEEELLKVARSMK